MTDSKKIKEVSFAIAQFASKQFAENKFTYEKMLLTMSVCMVMLGDDERVDHRVAVQSFLELYLKAWNAFSDKCQFSYDFNESLGGIRFQYDGDKE